MIPRQAMQISVRADDGRVWRRGNVPEGIARGEAVGIGCRAMKDALVAAALGLILLALANLPQDKNPCAEPVDLQACLGPMTPPHAIYQR